jgi:hypothetical protein
MIRVQVDILRRGDKCRKIPICELEIGNKQTDEETQDTIYELRFFKNAEGGIDLYDPPAELRFEVKHKRTDGIYVLLEKCFKKLK